MGSEIAEPYMTTVAEVTATLNVEKAAMKKGRPIAWPASWSDCDFAYLPGTRHICKLSRESLIQKQNVGNTDVEYLAVVTGVELPIESWDMQTSMPHTYISMRGTEQPIEPLDVPDDIT